jgi:OmcA/MtrC family decaheme c-type cytochrome
MFRLSDKDGTPLNSLSGLSRVAVNVNGPTTDFSEPPSLIGATIAGGGKSGTLTGPDAAGVFTYELATSLPGGAAGTWRVGLEARRSVALEGNGTVTEAIQNPVFDFSVDGSPVVHRRQVVDIANCGRCHGVFSKDFSIHGSLRNQTEYCVICHNPNATDFDTRSPAVSSDGANPVDEPINFKHLIHKIHTGEELEDKPYIVYGHNSTPNDFSEVLFPGDRRDCATCHVDGSYLLPLPEGVLPTINTKVDTTTTPFQEVAAGDPTPPTQDACLACHNADATRIHAETQTTASGDEACLVCHGEGKIAAVSEAHATNP